MDFALTGGSDVMTHKARTAPGIGIELLATLLLSLPGPFVDGTISAAGVRLPAMQKIGISADGRHFVLGDSGKAFVPWGFNYLGEFGKLMEDSWDQDWSRIERDFRAMRDLGANVVRIHLQFGTYMTGPNQFDQPQLDRLKKLLDLSQELGLYLDLTGLSCYRLNRIPAWYDALDEADRWDVQARWWKRIAETCANHPAVFCYDLMNEPIIGGPAKKGEPRWLGGELGGFYFVQRISEAPRGRTNIQIARAWTAKLTRAIRRGDSGTLITVGVIPWAQVWPTAKPVFYSPKVSKYLDFVSIHAYPGKDKVDQAITALAVYDIGKPLVVEETFPLNCSLEDMNRFVDGGKGRVDGWISHYFGHTIDEHRRGAEPRGTAPDAPFGVSVADFLKYWRDKKKAVVGASAKTPDRPESLPPHAKTRGLLAPSGLALILRHGSGVFRLRQRHRRLSRVGHARQTYSCDLASKAGSADSSTRENGLIW
jgi:hypothetical protein